MIHSTTELWFDHYINSWMAATTFSLDTGENWCWVDKVTPRQCRLLVDAGATVSTR